MIYAILVGASPLVLRAAIMGILALFARQLGRRDEEQVVPGRLGDASRCGMSQARPVNWTPFNI